MPASNLVAVAEPHFILLDNGITFDVGASGGEEVGRAGLDVSLPIRAAPVAGVLVEPTPGLHLGATYPARLS